MEKFVYYTKLFDCYKKLLSPQEALTFSYYYEEDLSLQEIAECRGVSKSAIGATIKNVELKLATYENALHLEARKSNLLRIITTIEDENLKLELEKILK